MEKLLIADDEEWIVEGLKLLLPWEELGICLTRTAACGQEALEIIKEENPAIVVTDIRMPGMDGLELAKYLFDRASECEVIIISGYADFNYARQAIAYGVSAYLTKPVIREELKKTVQEALSRIWEKRLRRQQLEQLQEAEKNRELTQCYLQEYPRKEEQADDKRYVTAVLEVTRLYSKDIEMTQITDRFEKEARDLSWNNGRGIFFCNRINPDQYILIVEIEEDCGYEEVCERLKRDIRLLQKRVHREMELEGIVGVSELYSDISQSFKAYLQAKFIAENLEGSGECRIVTAKEFDSIYSGVKVRHEAIQELITAMEEGSRKKVERLYSELTQNENRHTDALIRLRMNVQEMMISLSKLLERYGCSMYEMGCEYADVFRKIWWIDSCERLEDYGRILIEAAMERIEAVRHAGNESIIQQIRKYVDEHYMEPLNQNEIAKRFYINATYFSRAFKKEIGVNFTDYVRKRRMDEAETLLISTNLKIQDISDRVGYETPGYFTKKFQEVYGETPGKYREQNQKSGEL